MKKLFLSLFLSVFLIGASAARTARPTNEYLIYFDGGQSAVVEAGTIDEALAIFRREYKARVVYSAAKRSYVASVWIWGE